MKKELNILYEELKNKNEGKMEQLREETYKSKRKSSIISILIILILDLCYLYILLINGEKVNTRVIPLLVIDLIGFIIIQKAILLSYKYKKYRNMFKQDIIKELLNNFYDDVEYFPDDQMPKEIYKEGKYESFDVYKSDDYMLAKINGKYEIKMAEVHTETIDTDSDGNTSYRTVFHGIFAKIDLKKSINTELYIKQNGQLFMKDRVKMDSEEFEHYFDVSCKNQIVTMQLLTHDIMELLVELVKLKKIKYDIVIKKNFLYLRFKTGSMFELRSLKKGALDEKVITKNFEILKFIESLTNKLIKVIEETEV